LPGAPPPPLPLLTTRQRFSPIHSCRPLTDETVCLFLV
jgi:hypothetical protein